MVLGNLSRSLSAAFNRLRNETIVNEEIIERTLSDICRALIEADVNIHLIKQLRENVRQNIHSNQTAIGFNKRQLIKSSVREELIKLLEPGVKKWEPVKKQTNIVMFVGLQGNGKTTTCTKYAYYYMKRGWKTAVICADTYRAGAFEQLQQNAFKARIPFFGNQMESDPLVVAKEGVEIFRKENYELIIVDTSGRHAQEQALFEEMLQLTNGIKPDNVIFVMNASIGQACELQAKAFKSTIDIGSVIITKLDSGAKGGGALTAVATTQSPIIYLGTGEHIIDFEVFEAKSFVSKLLGEGDHVGLQKTIQEVINPNSDSIKRLKQGKFTLRDMYEQFQNVMKMGSIGQIMSMIPGFGTDIMSKNDERMSQIRLKKIMCIMDSMNDSELDHPDAVKFFDSQSNRYVRIARGAGVSVLDVEDLLEQYSTLSQVATMCGKPNKMIDELSKRLNPRIINQFGGKAGLSAMIKQFQ